MHRIALEIFTEIGPPRNNLLASKLGKKLSANLAAIQIFAAGKPSTNLNFERGGA